MGSADEMDCANENETDYDPGKDNSDAVDEDCSNLNDRESSQLWNHFVNLGKDIAECDHCGKKLSCLFITNLKRHLQIMHPQELKAKKIESAEEMDSADENEMDPLPGMDNSSDALKEDSSDLRKKKTSEVWNHFALLSTEIAKCNLCGKTIKYRSSPTNLKRHLKNTHSQEGKAEEMESAKEVDSEEENETDPEPGMDTSDALKEGCSDLLNGKKSKLWNYFSPLSKEIAKCKLCHRRVKYRMSATNLRKHLKTMHPQEGKAEEMESSKEGDSADENETDHEPEMDTSEAFEEDLSIILKRKTSELWNHFSPLSKEFAKCNHCSRKLNYRSSATNLKRHLKTIHSSIFKQLGKAENADTEIPTAMPKNTKKTKKSPAKKKKEKSPADKKAGNKKRLSKRNIYTSDEDLSDKGELSPVFDDDSDDYVPDESEVRATFWGASSKNKRQTRSSKGASSRIVSQRETSCSRKEGSPLNESEKRKKKETENKSEKRKKREIENKSEKRKKKETENLKRKKKGTENESEKESENESEKLPTVVPRPIKIRNKRKRSRLWDFFTVIDETFAECNTCKNRLVHKSGLSNLAKHYSMKHATPTANTEQQSSGVTTEHNSSGVTTAQTGMSEIEKAIHDLCDGQAPESQPIETLPVETSVPGTTAKKRSPRKRTIADGGHWRCAISKLFQRLDETYSQCKACHKRISHRSTNANLLKHTRTKHNDIYVKFEERIKDFSHNVNILVEHFFPESLIATLQPGDSEPQVVLPHEADQIPDQEYHGTDNLPPHMYDSYIFPVTYVQEEQVASTEQPIVTTSIQTNPIQAPPTNLPGPPSMGRESHTPNSGPSHMPNQTQEPSPLNNQMTNHHPLHSAGGVASNVGGVSSGSHREGGVVSDHRGGAHNVGVVNTHNHNVGVGNTHNHNVGGVNNHNVGGAFPCSYGEYYQQVLTTSFNVGERAAQSSDRLIEMVEESNQLLRGMQSAIEKQGNVLVRLAETLASGMGGP